MSTSTSIVSPVKLLVFLILDDIKIEIMFDALVNSFVILTFLLYKQQLKWFGLGIRQYIILLKIREYNDSEKCASWLNISIGHWLLWQHSL